MRRRTLLFIVFSAVFLLLFFSLSGVSVGQEELTQAFTSSDGKLSIRYPEGWVVLDSSSGAIHGAMLASSQDVLNQYALRSSRDAILLLQFSPSGPGAPGVSQLISSVSSMGDFGEPEEVTIAGFPAMQVRGSGTYLGVLSGDMLVAFVDAGEGVIGSIVGVTVTGNLAAVEPTFMAILATLAYGDAAPPAVETPAVENTAADLKPITTANAAEVVDMTTLRGPASPVLSLAFAPDGAALFSTSRDKALWVWDLSGATVAGTPHEQQVFGEGGSNMAVSPDGTLLASDDSEGSLVLRDAATGEVRQTLPGSSRVTGVAFSPDGMTLASIGLDGTLTLWDVAGGSARTRISAGRPTALAFSPDGSTIALGQLNSGEILVVNAQTGETLATLSGHSDSINALAFSPDAALLASAGGFSDKSIRLWDVASGAALAAFDGLAEDVETLAFNPDGTLLAAASPLMLIDVAAQQELELAALLAAHGFSILTSTTSLAFRPDGTALALGSSDGTIRLLGTTVDGGPLNIPQPPTSAQMEATAAPTEASSETPSVTCTISAPNTANLRSGPGTNFDRAGSLAAGQTAEVDGQAQGTDGLTWYRLTSGSWARSDVVNAPAECANVAQVTP